MTSRDGDFSHWHSWALRWGVLLAVPGRYFFCGSFVFLFCLVFAVSLCASVCVCFVVACWRGGGGWPLGSRLWCLLWVCHFPIGILGQVWYLIVSIPDLCTLTYFVQILLICIQQWPILDTSLHVCSISKSKWVWSGITKITHCRPTHGTERKRHRIPTSHNTSGRQLK